LHAEKGKGIGLARSSREARTYLDLISDSMQIPIGGRSKRFPDEKTWGGVGKTIGTYQRSKLVNSGFNIEGDSLLQARQS